MYLDGGSGYDIIEMIGPLSEPERSGWTKELNLVSWNGAEPKLDIRRWNETHKSMSRGITLTEDEARKLCVLLNEYFG